MCLNSGRNISDGVGVFEFNAIVVGTTEWFDNHIHCSDHCQTGADYGVEDA